MKTDRLRAKSPVNEEDDWVEGTVLGFEDTEYGKKVVVGSNDNQGVELKLTDAQFELFAGRIDAEEITGQTVWYKKKT